MKRKQAYLGKLRPQMLKISILPVALLCLSISFTVYAQLPGANSATPAQYPLGLEIGDEIPEEVWNERFKVINHPEGKESITLNDYKGKVIIFDFWATWCGSCIGQFPHLSKLQKKFQDSLAIIGVNSVTTRDTESRIARFRERYKSAHLLLSIIGDTVLHHLFPHHVVPHYAWIGMNGELRALTPSLFIQAETIQMMFENERMRSAIRQLIEKAKEKHEHLRPKK